MKKSIRDCVVNAAGANAPLVNVKEEHLEVAGLFVSKDGLRSMSIEEQVAQLRDRVERAEAEAEAARERSRRLHADLMRTIGKLKRLRAKHRRAK